MTYSTDPDCIAALAPRIDALRAQGHDQNYIDDFATAFAASFSKAFAQGRAEGATDERARCSAILSSPEAAGRKEVAMHFALSTSMAATDAVATLRTLPRRH